MNLPIGCRSAFGSSIRTHGRLWLNPLRRSPTKVASRRRPARRPGSGGCAGVLGWFRNHKPDDHDDDEAAAATGKFKQTLQSSPALRPQTFAVGDTNQSAHQQADSRSDPERGQRPARRRHPQAGDKQHDQAGPRKDLVEKLRTPKGKRQMGGTSHGKAEPEARAGTAADGYDRDEDMDELDDKLETHGDRIKVTDSAGVSATLSIASSSLAWPGTTGARRGRFVVAPTSPELFSTRRRTTGPSGKRRAGRNQPDQAGGRASSTPEGRA